MRYTLTRLLESGGAFRIRGLYSMRILLLCTALVLTGCPKNTSSPSQTGVEVRDLAGEAVESGQGAIDAVPEASAAAAAPRCCSSFPVACDR